MANVLVVDDEPAIRELIQLYLEHDGHGVTTAATGREALDIASRSKLDLIVLDIMLPDVDGFNVLKQIRVSSRVPVLFLSARKEDTDKIAGLELGADDYLTKPFNPQELLARVRAILRRRPGGEPRVEIIRMGRLSIDKARHEVRVDGHELKTRAKEFDLLVALAQKPGIVFSREKLLSEVWEFDYFGDTRTVDVHINHLRAILNNSGVDIETLWRTGYKMVVEEA